MDEDQSNLIGSYANSSMLQEINNNERDNKNKLR